MNDRGCKLLARQSYQWLSIVSCYSMVYYNNEYRSLRADAGATTTDLLVMGAGTYKFSIPIVVLNYLDLRAAKRSVSLDDALSPMLAADEMFYVHRTTSFKH